MFLNVMTICDCGFTTKATYDDCEYVSNFSYIKIIIIYVIIWVKRILGFNLYCRVIILKIIYNWFKNDLNIHYK